MSKLTTGQVANRLNISPYTIKRWYTFWENLEKLDVKELNDLVQKGMPTLPKYDTVGNRGDRVWDELDLPELIAFKQWVPHTKNGIFQKYENKGE